MSLYSEEANRKIQLYFASNYLFDLGKSYPQVVEIFLEYESDDEILNAVVEQARVDHWRKVFNEVQRLTSEGRTFSEIIEAVKYMESDPEIVHFIVNTWYHVKSAYINNIIDSPGNIYEGSQCTIISVFSIVAVFYFKTSIVAKVVWIFCFIVALSVWLQGLK